MELGEIKMSIFEMLTQERDITLCILFGSAAEGRISSSSDVDIALGAENIIPFERLAQLQRILTSILGMEADVVDLRRCEGVFLQQILSKGDVLLKKDLLLYAELIRRMWYFNADMRKNYEYVIHKQMERVLNGT